MWSTREGHSSYPEMWRITLSMDLSTQPDFQDLSPHAVVVSVYKRILGKLLHPLHVAHFPCMCAWRYNIRFTSWRIIVSPPAFDCSGLLEEIAGTLSLFARRQPIFYIADGKVRVDLRLDKVSSVCETRCLKAKKDSNGEDQEQTPISLQSLHTPVQHVDREI